MEEDLEYSSSPLFSVKATPSFSEHPGIGNYFIRSQLLSVNLPMIKSFAQY